MILKILGIESKIQMFRACRGIRTCLGSSPVLGRGGKLGTLCINHKPPRGFVRTMPFA